MSSPVSTLESLSNPSPASVDPTILVGTVRSGTTLLRLMLDHHPELAFHFEFEFAVDKIGPDGQFPPLAEYHRFLRQDRIFNLSEAEIDPALDYPALVKSFLEQKRQRDGKRLVGATIHHHLDRIRYLWPNAKFVHILRDGRDVARSIIQMGWAGNMYTGVDRWIETEKTWANLQQTISDDRWIEVRYEDLIADAEGQLSRLCDFIGVEFSPAMFDYAKTSTYGLPDPKLISQWRSKLSPRELQLAESRIADMLVERGYELSGNDRLEVDAVMKEQLLRDDWWRRAQFRRRRYGNLLFATDFVARKLRIGPLARACKQRCDAIENLHIR